jgi:hypothetical protein
MGLTQIEDAENLGCFLPENNVGLTRNFMLVENKAGYLINN